MNSPTPSDAPQKKRFLEMLPLLISSLRDEMANIERLDACLIREREILCGGSPGDLFDSNGEKERILLDLEEIRSQRSPVLAELSDLLGIPSGQATVSLLASRATGPARRELMGLGRGLRQLVQQIQSRNTRNHGLIENTRQYVGNWLNFLLNAASSAPCYAKSGVVPQTGLKGRFFRAEG
jgi:flagellar biosynthesis/type III secretory pathway chaperone